MNKKFKKCKNIMKSKYQSLRENMKNKLFKKIIFRLKNIRLQKKIRFDIKKINLWKILKNN